MPTRIFTSHLITSLLSKPVQQHRQSLRLRLKRSQIRELLRRVRIAAEQTQAVDRHLDVIGGE